MALKAGYKGIKNVGPGLKLDNTNGRLELEGESTLELENLEDVSITEPAGGDILAYSDADDLWFNQTPANAPTQGSLTPISSGAVYDELSVRSNAALISSANMNINEFVIAKAGKIRVCTIVAQAIEDIAANTEIITGIPDKTLLNNDALVNIIANTPAGVEYKLFPYTLQNVMSIKTLVSIPNNTSIRFTFTYISQ